MAISVNIDGSWEEIGHIEPYSLDISHEPYEYYNVIQDPSDFNYKLSYLAGFESKTISIPFTQVGKAALAAAMGIQALGDAFNWQPEGKDCDLPLWEQG
jgi:hypothetical protein